tara:strand:+ start:3352 stop:3810 length:459 start_codon:yes stop_codon:yes gene_type:complete
MTDQEILDNAPEGATHYAPKLHYIARNKNGDWMRYDPNGIGGYCWFEANDYYLSYADDYRSLSDIRQLVEKNKRIEALELQCAKYENSLAGNLVRDQEKRDLEMKAAGIEGAVDNLESTSVIGPRYMFNAIKENDLYEIAEKLRKQAQEIGK